MTISELHKKALEYTDIAIIKRFNGDSDASLIEFSKALHLEKEAALLSLKENIGEPTQSVLLKSAASLAINCKEYREAEKLVTLALSGDPPFEIAEELRIMLEEVNFSRHLDLNGMVLDENELQFSMAGRGVGYGLARSKDVWDRFNNFEKDDLSNKRKNAWNAI